MTEMVSLLDALTLSAGTTWDGGGAITGALTTTEYVGMDAAHSLDGANHTGDCHFTDTVDEFGRADPWMDATQCKPRVVQTTSGLDVKSGGKLCGCGLLLIKGSGGAGSLKIANTGTGQLLWSGLIVVYSNAANLTLDIQSTAASPWAASMYLDGGFLGVGSGGSTDLQMGTKLNGLTGGMSTYIRYNPAAISKALSKTQTITRKSFRVLY